MGAWIEIRLELLLTLVVNVAPFVGAWIEILLHGNNYPIGLVAPFVGAWIEIPALLALS